jgi:hypothetical protein
LESLKAEFSERDNVMNVKFARQLRLMRTASLAGVVVARPGFASLDKPVGTVVRQVSTFPRRMMGGVFSQMRVPTLRRTKAARFAIVFGKFGRHRKGFSAVCANLLSIVYAPVASPKVALAIRRANGLLFRGAKNLAVKGTLAFIGACFSFVGWLLEKRCATDHTNALLLSAGLAPCLKALARAESALPWGHRPLSLELPPAMVTDGSDKNPWHERDITTVPHILQVLIFGGCQCPRM